MPPRILFVQHAASLGGSCVSLLTTLRSIDRSRFEPVLALANDSVEVSEFYRAAGYTPILCPGLPFWNHTTGGVTSLADPRAWLHLARVACTWSRGEHDTLRLVDAVKPALVHLNSVVLSASASALEMAGIPYIWHVREHPPDQGVRTSLLRRLLQRASDRAIFISDGDRRAWLRHDGGHVIHNFVTPDAFVSLDRGVARATLGVPVDAPIILYLGGLSRIKGIEPFLDSLRRLVGKLPSLRVLMPSAVYAPPANPASRIARRLLPVVGSGTTGQRAERLLAEPSLDQVCIRLPFQTDTRRLYAAADVLVFPAVRPHFARPVIEAAAAGIPAVASQFPGMDELIKDGVTGVLVPPSDSIALETAITKLLLSPVQRQRMGGAARAFASERFDARRSTARIMDLYDRTLARTSVIRKSFA